MTYTPPLRCAARGVKAPALLRREAQIRARALAVELQQYSDVFRKNAMLRIGSARRTVRGLSGRFAVCVALASAGSFAEVSLWPQRASAEDMLSADEIAAKIVRGNGFTWEGAKTRLRMVLVEAGGAQAERSMEVLGRRHDGRLQTKVTFLSPQDSAGTKFLTVENADGKTEQHIYLPGLKRTRRVVGREREGSFMGSDFSYGDLVRKDGKGTKHVKLNDESIGPEPTYVLESTPGNVEEAGYSKIRTWVRKTDFVPLRTQFFDASGKLKKTLFVQKIRVVDGRPVVTQATMKSENGHKTELVVDDIQKRDDLPDADFSPTSLER
jgi:outer membrane lipoprotein-sorting protein